MHHFYLPDRLSVFLQQRLITSARNWARLELWGTGEYDEELISDSEIVDWVMYYFAVRKRDILEYHGGAFFNPADLLAIEAAELAEGLDSVVLFADDPIYSKAKKCPNLIFIRTGGEETMMRTEVKWVNVDNIFCIAYGVKP